MPQECDGTGWLHLPILFWVAQKVHKAFTKAKPWVWNQIIINANQCCFLPRLFLYLGCHFIYEVKLPPVNSFHLSQLCRVLVWLWVCDSSRMPHPGLLWVAGSCTDFSWFWMSFGSCNWCIQFCCCAFRWPRIDLHLSRMFGVVKMQNKRQSLPSCGIYPCKVSVMAVVFFIHAKWATVGL